MFPLENRFCGDKVWWDKLLISCPLHKYNHFWQFVGTSGIMYWIPCQWRLFFYISHWEVLNLASSHAEMGPRHQPARPMDFMAFTSLGWFVPGSFASWLIHLRPWTICPLARSPPGSFAAWLIHPLSLDDLPLLSNMYVMSAFFWNEFLHICLGVGLITATACWPRSKSIDSVLQHCKHYRATKCCKKQMLGVSDSVG